MSKAHDKVTARMNAKVDAHALAYKVEPDLHEKVVLELSSAIAFARDPDYAAVSWEIQLEAAAYFNEHGFTTTLDYMLDLQTRGKDALRTKGASK